MHSIVLSKVAFWMIVIGTVAEYTPNPAWPESVARGVFWGGVALGVVTLLLGLWKARRTLGGADKDDASQRD